MSKKFNVALVGATGAVGVEIIRLMEERNFPLESLRLFASPRSHGKEINGRRVEILDDRSFVGMDFVFFSAGKKISLQYAPIAAKAGAIAIDNSSAFRKDPSVPLIIPEINPEDLKNHSGIVACPNCTTAIMLMALAPLHRKVPIKRIVAASYQAASGAGAEAMQELQEETRAVLNGKSYERKIFQDPYAFNLFIHNSPLLDNGYVEEELKMVHETHKILNDDSIRITATCVRVPVMRAHSLALNVEFHGPLSAQAAYQLLQTVSGLKIFEDRNQNRFPTPLDASGKNDVLCGRIREDLSQSNTLELWVVGDQLLKGAALNVIQIAEHLF